jgi:hypothetical protein
MLREKPKINTEHPQHVCWSYLKMEGMEKGKEGKRGKDL